MPYSVPSGPTELTTLNSVIDSMSARLSGVAPDDPAGRLLREQLDELVARRDELLAQRERNERQGDRVLVVLLSILIVFCLAGIWGTASDLAGPNPTDFAEVFGLVISVLCLMIFGPILVLAWREARKDKRSR
ncbi:hypothetical protein [Actinomadura oligospora]|uniref:hypothetical protein n=1 Tax=Actinomadura oligospora TaxID=111804 RepID=UPI0004B49533|nr:hypothetical protein [Actinomadura oligospora]